MCILNLNDKSNSVKEKTNVSNRSLFDALEWAENRKILVKSNIFQNRQANFLPGLVELTSQPIRPGFGQKIA